MTTPGLSNESEPKLTPEAERVVRAFVIRQITPTGIALVVLSFFSAFLIRDMAVRQAELSAVLKIQEPAQAALIKLTTDIATTQTKAQEIISQSTNLLLDLELMNEELRGKTTRIGETLKDAETQAELVQKRISEAKPKLDDLERIAATVKTWEGFQETDNVVTSVVQALRADPAVLLAQESVIKKQIAQYLADVPLTPTTSPQRSLTEDWLSPNQMAEYYKQYAEGFKKTRVGFAQFMKSDEELKLYYLDEAQRKQWDWEEQQAAEAREAGSEP